jgi:hypothetical protein
MQEGEMDLRAFVYERFAIEVGLTPADLLSDGVTLRDVAARSPRITNSVDLMECFAGTSNAIRKEFGIRVRLPAYPVNTTVRELVEAFVEQAEILLSKEAVA